jgi:hypothetical protein
MVSYSSGGTTRLPGGGHGGSQHGKTTTNSHHRNGHQGAQEARWQVQHPTGLRPAEGQKWSGSGIKATTAKPNPFDEIARQVNADQEAKDRAAGRDDLTLAAATSVDQAKLKSSGTRRAATKPATPARPAKPTRPIKGQANRNGVSFSGRRRPRPKRSPLE